MFGAKHVRTAFDRVNPGMPPALELRMAKAPSPLDDAIKAQQGIVNQLADEHAAAHIMMVTKGEQLQRAHAELTNLLNRKLAK